MPDIIKTLLLVVIFLLFTAIPHAGFMIIIFAPFLIASIIHRLFQAWKNPGQRRRHMSRVVIWIGAIILYGMAHIYYFYKTRATAEMMVASISSYKERTGKYPGRIDELGLHQGHDGVFYGAEDGEPHLFHWSTFTPFDTYQYDFTTHQWQFSPD